MVGDLNLLKERREKMEKFGIASLGEDPLKSTYEFLFKFIDLKLWMASQLEEGGVKVGIMHAYGEMLDGLLTLAVRAGYDDSKVMLMDHAWHNHSTNMRELEAIKKMIQ